MEGITINPAVARRVIDRRWPDEAGSVYLEPDRAARFVASNLELAAKGITHDERSVDLYWQESAT